MSEAVKDSDAPDYAWEASEIAPEEREKLYKLTKSYHRAMRALRGLMYKIYGAFGALGMVAAAAEALAIMMMLPLKQTVPVFYEVDKQTGWIGSAISVHDAPKAFSTRNAEHFLRIYLKSRLGYVAEDDQDDWDIVQTMSAAPEWQKYLAERKADGSPQRTLSAARGQQKITNPLFGTPLYDGGTWSFPAHYGKLLVRNEAVGVEQQCNAVIDFQWHPEMPMTQLQADINPGGMQVVSLQEIGCHQ